MNFNPNVAGYLLINVSHDDPSEHIEAYFDDMEITHDLGPLLQYNEYYPFGMKNEYQSYTRERTLLSRFDFNGTENLSEASQHINQTFFRLYDKSIGRWLGVDPVDFAQWNPYNFGFNNPAYYTDPLGDCPDNDDGNGADGNKPCEKRSAAGWAWAVKRWGVQGAFIRGYRNVVDGKVVEVEPEPEPTGTTAADDDEGDDGDDGWEDEYDFIILIPDGTEVMDPLDDWWGYLSNAWDGRTYTPKGGGFTYNVDADGKIAGRAPVLMIGPDISPAGKIVKLGKSLTPRNLKAAKSLYKQMVAHMRKLRQYLKDPHSFDNVGHLSKNAGNPAVQRKIIEGRARHLQKEIDTFYNNILKLFE